MVCSPPVAKVSVSSLPAALELKTVLSLIEPDSVDFQKVQENLKAIPLP